MDAFQWHNQPDDDFKATEGAMPSELASKTCLREHVECRGMLSWQDGTMVFVPLTEASLQEMTL